MFLPSTYHEQKSISLVAKNGYFLLLYWLLSCKNMWQPCQNASQKVKEEEEEGFVGATRVHVNNNTRQFIS